MKTPFFSSLLSAIALAAASAQTPRPDAATGATAAESTTVTTTANQSATSAATTGHDVGLSSQDGVTISGGAVMITRNGVTERVTNEISFPNGTRIKPDGTIVSSGGEKVMLAPEQILGLDGKVYKSPIPGSVSVPVSSNIPLPQTVGTAPGATTTSTSQATVTGDRPNPAQRAGGGSAAK